MAITQANLTQGSALTVTNNVVTGTGVFDDLMEAVTTHLEAQYQLGRITGGDFATVYLGAMQAAISQSVSFTLGQESTNAAVILQTKQGLKVDKDALLVVAQELLTDAQKLKVDADELLVDKQVVKLAADIALGVKQGALVDAQELKVDADKLLVDAQKLKVDGEKALLLQKQTTEFAQTRVTGNNTPHADSILGKQASLYGEQAKGFKWNADQKYLKTIFDAWAINISTAGVADTAIVALKPSGAGNIQGIITNALPSG